MICKYFFHTFADVIDEGKSEMDFRKNNTCARD